MTRAAQRLVSCLARRRSLRHTRRPHVPDFPTTLAARAIWLARGAAKIVSHWRSLGVSAELRPWFQRLPAVAPNPQFLAPASVARPRSLRRSRVTRGLARGEFDNGSARRVPSESVAGH